MSCVNQCTYRYWVSQSNNRLKRPRCKNVYLLRSYPTQQLKVLLLLKYSIVYLQYHTILLRILATSWTNTIVACMPRKHLKPRKSQSFCPMFWQQKSAILPWSLFPLFPYHCIWHSKAMVPTSIWFSFIVTFCFLQPAVLIWFPLIFNDDFSLFLVCYVK